LVLTDELRQKFAASSHLMVQFNKEAGAPERRRSIWD
jgi:hypothetical protein